MSERSAMQSSNYQTALAFLTSILPSDGYYCATVFAPDQYPFNAFRATIPELAAFILEADESGRTVYHACASFRSATRRTHDNALGAKAFWLDVDTGPKKPYPNALSAWEAVETFRRGVALPPPVYVSSGSGLHVYWPLQEALDPPTWRQFALGLKSLCARHGLKVDNSRTSDISSVLRTPGTHNRKNGEVNVEWDGRTLVYSSTDFQTLRQAAGDRQTVIPQRRQSIISRALATSPSAYAAASLEAIAVSCGQIGLFKSTGNLAEPQWKACLGVAAWCEGGDALAHEWSKNDFPDYDAEETQGKLDRARQLTGPTTCSEFEGHNPETCAACPHRGSISSPIALGRYVPPRTQRTPLAGTQPTGLPALRFPFAWSTERQIIMQEGDEEPLVISEYPVYVVDVARSEIARSSYGYMFCREIPKEGRSTFSLTAKEVFGNGGVAAFADKGALIRHGKLFLQCIMQQIEDYHREHETKFRYDQFGWKDDNTSFLFGSKLYTADGPQDALGSPEITTRCEYLGPTDKGALAAWVDATDHLFIKGMEAVSTAVLCAPAAPLMRFASATEGGCWLHLYSPQSGPGKTTAQQAAWTFWGRKNGLNLTNIDTRVSKMISLGVLGNLPVIYDEIAATDPDHLRKFIMSFSDGRDSMRGLPDGTIRHLKASWQTIGVSGSNSSLLETLPSEATDAAAYRVLQLSVELPQGVDKSQHKKWTKQLEDNSGHAGDAYLRYLLQPAVLEWAKDAVEKLERDIWSQTELQQAHRFRVRLVACIAVAGRICNHLGILNFSTQRIVDWLLERLKGRDHAGTITERSETERCIELLGQYLLDHAHETLVVDGAYKRGHVNLVRHAPKTRVSARFECDTRRLYVSQTMLRHWLLERYISPAHFYSVLHTHNVLVANTQSKTLTAGTDLPGAQVLIVECNGQHPAMSGFVGLVERLQEGAQSSEARA